MEKNSARAAQEAKELIRNKQKNQAIFCIKRKQLYDSMLSQVSDQYAIIERAIIEVESAVQMKEFTKVLQEGNDLIKELDLATQLETLKEVGADMKERDQSTREFNKMFEEHHLKDEDVDKMYSQWEAEMNGDAVLDIGTSQKINNNANIIKPERELAVSKKKNNNQMDIEEEDNEQEANRQKLMDLA
jgi:hypothetical protein